MTPLLRPVWPVATAGAPSSTTAERSGWRLVSSRATARPRMPAPTTARSHSPGAWNEAISAGLLLGHAPGEELEIRVDHQPDHLLEAGTRLPAELLAGLGGIADEMLNLGGAEETRVGPNVGFGIEPGMLECHPHEVADAVRLAGGDHEILGLVLLEHQPHGLDVVLGVAPVALGIQVAEHKLVLKAELDGGGAVGDFAGDELKPAALRLVVEADPRHREEVVGLSVVDRNEVPVALRHAVRRPRIKRRGLALRHFADHAEHLR